MTQNEKTPNLMPTRGHAELTPTLNSIRERAFQKWQAAGRPTGDNVSFWEAAEQEFLKERLMA
jgi:Protein of unknown function (DUF2934)